MTGIMQANVNNIISAPSIVTGNNMLLYLDAGNSTSYSGSGSTWTDLSGNTNNATNVNSATYSTNARGYFTFNGSNNYFTTAGSKYNVSYTGKTIFIAAQLASTMTSGTYRCLFGGGGTPVGRNFNTYLYYTGSAYQIHLSSNNLGGISNNTVITPGTWFTIAVTQNTSGLISYYCNGQLVNTQSSTFSQYVSDQYEQVGASDNFWNGAISVACIYGSELSSAQILQNHNAIRMRYGLQ